MYLYIYIYIYIYMYVFIYIYIYIYILAEKVLAISYTNIKRCDWKRQLHSS